MVGTSKEYGNNMHRYLTKKEAPQFPEPPEPQPAKEGEAISTAQMERYKIKLRDSIEEEKSWGEQLGRMFRTVLAMCAPPMRNTIESDPRYDKLYAANDVNGLLDLIKEKVYGTDERKDPLYVAAGAMMKLHSLQQHAHESPANFHKRFHSQLEVTESVWGQLIPQMMKGKPTTDQEKARKAYIARLYLLGLHKNYKGVIDDLNKAHINGRKEYPQDLEAALTWVTKHTEVAGDSHGNNSKLQKSNSDGMNDDGMLVFSLVLFI